MIIDTHLHYGTFGNFSLKLQELLHQMDLHGIEKGIVSTIECCEYQAEKEELMPEQIPQLKANETLLEAIRPYRERLSASFWCKPASQQNTEEVYDFIKKHREVILGLKLHPFYSRLALEDPRYDSYLEVARQLKLPVSVHTANDMLSNPYQLLAMAKRHPDVSFIMVHMGLNTDHELAIECLTQADNLFGDTTWVPMDKVLKAIAVCGSEKMLFGSDAPIDGNRSYVFYEAFLSHYKENPNKEWDNLMYRNAKRIFGI
jgi:uncharacterized protein